VLREDDVMQVEDFKFNDSPKGSDRPEEQTLTVRVIDYTPINTGKALQGFVDVRIDPPGLILRGWRHIKTRHGYILQSPAKFVRVGSNFEDKREVMLMEFFSRRDALDFEYSILRQIEDYKQEVSRAKENTENGSSRKTGQSS